MNQPRRYLAYLLRLWQDSAGEPPQGGAALWRASLQSSQSEKVRGFASLDGLFAFLQEQTVSGRPDPEHPEVEGK